MIGHEPMVVLSARGGNRVGRFLFGMVFTAAGAFAIYAYFNLDVQGDAWVALLVGSIFVVMGLSIAGFYRRRVLDKLAGHAEIITGYFIPLKRIRHPLSKFQQVSLRHEVRTRSNWHGSSSHDVYPLRIEGQENMELGEWTVINEARRQAEAVAKYLDIPLSDSSSGTTVTRVSRDLDKNLAQRLRQAGERAACCPANRSRAKSPYHLSVEKPGWCFPERA